MNFKSALLVVPLFFLVGNGLADTLHVTDDSFIKADNLDENKGDDKKIELQDVTDDKDRTGFVNFDLSTLPAGLLSEDIPKATLRLWIEKVDEPGTILISLVNDEWDEHLITMANAPSRTPTGKFLAITKGDENSFRTVDVTDLVQNWIADDSESYGLALEPADGIKAVVSAKETEHEHEMQIEVALDQELSEAEVLAYVVNNGFVSGPHYTDADAISAVGPHLTQADVEAFLASRFETLESDIASLQGLVASQASLIAALQSDLSAAQSLISALGTDFGTLQLQFGDHAGDALLHHARYTDAEAVVAVGPHFSGDHADLANVTTDQHHENQAVAVDDLNALLYGVSRGTNESGYDTLYFSGMNMQLVNGLGDTESSNGTGNLIIGYNELRPEWNPRDGSHMLVIGGENNYTADAWAGVVVGWSNEVSAPFASIMALGSSAEGRASRVSGGINNRAIGDLSSITGGSDNAAIGLGSSITGGQWNQVEAMYSSVTGGHHNLANETGWFASISGGEGNETGGIAAHISGGLNNKGWGDNSTVSGGENNIAGHNMTVVSGGANNIANAEYASVSGGGSNNASGHHSWIGGGENNEASGAGASISGGKQNNASGWVSSVTGGSQNYANGNASSVNGGDANSANGFWATVGGGRSRTANAVDSWVAVDVMPRLANLESNVTTLDASLGTHSADPVAHHARYTDAEAVVAVGPHFSGDHNDLVNVNSNQHHANLAGDPIFDLSPFVSVSLDTINGVVGPHVLFEGANVHVRSGHGQTGDLITGLGNLIVGYNEDNDITFPRTGAHNLVLGSRNGFSSYGGMVAGEINWISAAWATIAGGQWNEARGHHSSIGGGGDNTTTGYAAHVSGGFVNQATAFAATVSGGRSNIASANSSSVTGGWSNLASGNDSVAIGGMRNEASGEMAVVIAGEFNDAPGTRSIVVAGQGNLAQGLRSGIFGGAINVTDPSAEDAAILGGRQNHANGWFSTVSGGEGNVAEGWAASVSGGGWRAALGDHDWVAGTLFEDH